jgi:hypothetical protein
MSKSIAQTQWEQAMSIAGATGSRTLPDGTVVNGQYKLVEASSPITSHNPINFSKNPLFPTNSNGTTMNDRDYEHDQFAKEMVQSMGADFDSRALEDVPYVNSSGIVLSGNNRLMSSVLASQNGADQNYVNALKDKLQQFGFTSNSVEKFQHPRLVFQTNDSLFNNNLNTSVFAKFNQSTGKAMNPVNRAISLSKRMDYSTLQNIASDLSGVMTEGDETMSDVWSDATATDKVFTTLQNSGIIPRNEMEQYYSDGSVTASGKDFVESVLLGSVISPSNLMALNKEGTRQYRQKIIRSIIPLMTNNASSNSFNKQLNKAISIITSKDVVTAKNKNSAIMGMTRDLFSEFQPSRGAVGLALALLKKPKDFANLVGRMSHELNESAGTGDLFNGGEPRTVAEVMEDYIGDFPELQGYNPSSISDDIDTGSVKGSTYSDSSEIENEAIKQPKGLYNIAKKIREDWLGQMSALEFSSNAQSEEENDFVTNGNVSLPSGSDNAIEEMKSKIHDYGTNSEHRKKLNARIKEARQDVKKLESFVDFRKARLNKSGKLDKRFKGVASLLKAQSMLSELVEERQKLIKETKTWQKNLRGFENRLQGLSTLHSGSDNANEIENEAIKQPKGLYNIAKKIREDWLGQMSALEFSSNAQSEEENDFVTNGNVSLPSGSDNAKHERQHWEGDDPTGELLEGDYYKATIKSDDEYKSYDFESDSSRYRKALRGKLSSNDFLNVGEKRMNKGIAEQDIYYSSDDANLAQQTFWNVSSYTGLKEVDDSDVKHIKYRKHRMTLPTAHLRKMLREDLKGSGARLETTDDPNVFDVLVPAYQEFDENGMPYLSKDGKGDVWNDNFEKLTKRTQTALTTKLEQDQKKENERKKEEKEKEHEKGVLKTLSVLTAVLTTLGLIARLVKNIVIASVERGKTVIQNGVTGTMLGVSPSDVNRFSYKEIESALPEGTFTNAMSSLQMKFGNVEKLDEKAIDTLAMIMGSGVRKSIEMGLGANNPKALMAQIIDATLSRANSGKGLAGTNIGVERASAEWLARLSGVDQNLSRVVGTILQMQKDGYNINSFSDYMGRKPVVDNVDGAQYLIRESSRNAQSAMANLKEIRDTTLDQILVSLNEFFTWVRGLRIFKTDADKEAQADYAFRENTKNLDIAQTQQQVSYKMMDEGIKRLWKNNHALTIKGKSYRNLKELENDFKGNAFSEAEMYMLQQGDKGLITSALLFEESSKDLRNIKSNLSDPKNTKVENVKNNLSSVYRAYYDYVKSNFAKSGLNNFEIAWDYDNFVKASGRPRYMQLAGNPEAQSQARRAVAQTFGLGLEPLYNAITGTIANRTGNVTDENLLQALTSFRKEAGKFVFDLNITENGKSQTYTFDLELGKSATATAEMLNYSQNYGQKTNN